MAKHKIEGATVKSDLKKKKKWVTILAPALFHQTELGETLCEDPAKLVGRVLKVNLVVLTNDPKRQNVSLLFKIVNITGERANASLVGYQLSTAYVRRMVRRGSEKVEDSFPVVSKDGLKFQIKPILLMRVKNKNSVLTALRMKLREHTTALFKDTPAEDVLHMIISNKFQKEAKDILKKIYPVGMCEIRLLRQQ